MQCQRRLDTLGHPFANHLLSPFANFFGRLKRDPQGASEMRGDLLLRFMNGQSSAVEHRRVRVMSASVHETCVLTPIDLFLLIVDRKGIHVGP